MKPAIIAIALTLLLNTAMVAYQFGMLKQQVEDTHSLMLDTRTELREHIRSTSHMMGEVSRPAEAHN